jgi:hypothetical protein
MKAFVKAFKQKICQKMAEIFDCTAEVMEKRNASSGKPGEASQSMNPGRGIVNLLY